MQIAEYMGQYANTMANPSVTKSQGTAATQRVGESLMQMQEGTIFEGSINSLEGTKVLLGLSNGQTLSARLDGSINLLLGQSLFFQVKSNDGNTIAIRPYMGEGGAINPTIQKALEAAGYEMNEETVGMVNRMMEEGLSIDRSSLHAMRQAMVQNPQVSMNTLMDMVKLGIPTNTRMVSQFENYRMDQHQMLHQMDQLMDQLPEVFADKTLDSAQLMARNTRIVEILTQGMDQGEQQPLFVEAKGEELQGQQPENMQTPIPQKPEAAAAEPLPAQAKPEAASPQGQPESSPKIADEASLEQSSAEQEIDQASAKQPIHRLLSEQQLGRLEQQLQNLFPQQDKVTLNRELTARALLDSLNAQLEKSPLPDREALGRLLSGKEYHTLLKDVMEQQWTVTPEDLKSKDNKVEQLYEKLSRQMGQLEQLAKAANLASGGLTESIQQVRSNIDFMNQINQAYTYVQLPLKLANQNAHGDLYVYTNKRNLQKREGELSAFLHLDLDHLGSTDVSIKMLDKKVSTKFYLSDDDAYSLIEQNLPRLEERLKRLGYNCTISLENREKKLDFVDDFLKEGAKAGSGGRSIARGMVHRYSFDVRA